MPTTHTRLPAVQSVLTPSFDRIARRIGSQLRDMYAPPETEQLPVEHVELLLRLVHKERDLARDASRDG